MEIGIGFGSDEGNRDVRRTRGRVLIKMVERTSNGIIGTSHLHEGDKLKCPLSTMQGTTANKTTRCHLSRNANPMQLHPSFEVT